MQLCSYTYNGSAEETGRARMLTRRAKVKALKSSSFEESFPGRLEWKKRHFDKPVTSTPVPLKSKTVQSTIVKDVATAFGFDDSFGDEDYHTTPISPIIRMKDKVDVENQGDRIKITRVPQPAPLTENRDRDEKEQEVHNFSELLHRYGAFDNDEDELQLNRQGTKTTYAKTKKKTVNLPLKVKQMNRKKRERSTIITHHPEKSKRPRRGQEKKENVNEKLAPEMEKWLEAKNKEFEDISKFPLVVEKSTEASPTSN